MISSVGAKKADQPSSSSKKKRRHRSRQGEGNQAILYPDHLAALLGEFLTAANGCDRRDVVVRMKVPRWAECPQSGMQY